MGQVLFQGVGQVFLTSPGHYYRQFRDAAPRAGNGPVGVSGGGTRAGMARHPKQTNSPAVRCGPGTESFWPVKQGK